MTKPTTRSTAPPTAEELRERLNDESKTVDDDTALRAQVELWARLRAAFAANSLSSGIDALDDLAMTAIADDSATKLSLASTAVLLPSTDLPSPQEQPAHALFAPAPATARSKRTNSRGKGKVGAAPAKKRHTVIKSRRSWFQLPSNAPKKIKEDLARLEEVAAEQDTSPERLAYRWRDQRAWCDPREHPDLHLQHWRFFMRHRPTFLVLALYAPTDDAAGRRKLKSLACQKRLLFISYNIEEFGFFGFMELFQNGAHDHLIWLGGKVAKHSTGAKKAKSREDAVDPPQDELAQLLRHDPSHYERVIERVLDHTRVDDEGYTSIRELLEQSNALDPSRPAHLQLSTNALARIVLDVSTMDPPNPSWVGHRSTGPWKKLLSDHSLRSVQAKLDKRLRKGKSVVTYDHKKFKASEQREDDCDFKEDGAPVILPPTPPVTKSTRDVPKQQDHTGLTDSSDDKEEDEEFPPPGRHGGEEDAPSDAFADDKLNENGPSDGSDDGPDPPKGSSDKKAGSKGDDRSTSKTSSSDKSDDAPSPDDKASKDSK
ncbi:hypothetical protein PR003_g19650 [Phytophthora rubi]|uniref:Uncharacterized protein n=1 Tax=Phytophthora rubi TaxID=129364 RepID=A0A6A3K5T6_9STRA|nr:hypothetical protein PR002_g18912 [Phytophthora rubi]KAE9001692.1 hypothetical protein PR001_g18459 [Phytophthora rubi]KAE9312907.1 hypothetical protein PR003_g19650 [Phytophthora rubi]